MSAAVLLVAFLSIAGTWVAADVDGERILLTLGEDGHGVLDGEAFRFELAGNRLRVTDAGGEQVEYAFTLKGDRLTISGGDFAAPVTFARLPGGSGAKPAPAPSQGPNPLAPPAANPLAPGGAAPPAPAAAPGIEGTWLFSNEHGRFAMVLAPGGSGRFNQVPLEWKHEPGMLTISMNGATVAYGAILAGDALTLSGGDLAGPTTFRRGRESDAPGAAPAGPAAGPEGAVRGVAGVWVAEEASLDPQLYMRYTQVVTLFPDGTVGYAKSEAGASRQQVTATLERFRSWRTGVEGGGGDSGHWESDGRRIVVRWNRPDGLVSQGEVDLASGRLTLSGMGALEEGATLTFRREE